MRIIGEIDFYWGTMFTGKTSRLIEELAKAGEKAMCFKPKADTRDDGVIRTHDGTEFPVTQVRNAIDILPLLSEDITTVGIDEISLFGDDPSLIGTLELLRMLGYKVIATGLDRDYEDMPFGQSGMVATIADNCYKLRVKCGKCGERLASISHLKDKDADSHIGGSEKYIPLCRQCYNEV